MGPARQGKVLRELLTAEKFRVEESLCKGELTPYMASRISENVKFRNG